MNPLGLSPEQLEARKRYVCAGDAAKILAGEWRQVWREKMGLAEEDDLSGELRVQLGSFTEPFNFWWCERSTGRPIKYFSGSKLMREIWFSLHVAEFKLGGGMTDRETQVSVAYPFMACNLDGMTTTPQGHRCVIDAKHVGKFGEAEMLRYTAAGTHQATVMGCDWWALSVLIGNSKHEVWYQEVDPLYQARLIAAEREFWGYVERGEEPEGRTEPTLPPKPQPKLRQIILDITPPEERPNWAPDFTRLAKQFAETDGAAKANAIAREDIKKLVPDDVGLVRLGLVKYKRDGRGQTVSMEKADG